MAWSSIDSDVAHFVPGSGIRRHRVFVFVDSVDSPLLGRLHDGPADKIAAVVSRIPGASAQIVAYDIASRIRITQANRASGKAPPTPPSVADNPTGPPERRRASVE